MIQLDSTQRTVKHPIQVRSTSVSSRVAPWIALLYPLAGRVILPVCFDRVVVVGQENLPKTGAVILAPTHRSRWDPIILAHAAGRPTTGRDLRFMTTASEMLGIQGWFVRRLGGFPVDLRRPGIGSLRHGVELLQQSQMLAIFPEGGIFHEAKVQSLKPGLARLALQAELSQPDADLKIVPVGIHYSTEKAKWRCQVTVNIGEPISVRSYLGDSVKQSAKVLTADLSREMQALYGASMLCEEPLETASVAVNGS
jgi:1-acyl-sn-glycerol-3-phosphate acyltransferase